MLLQPRFLQRRCLLGRGRGVRRQSGERTGRTRRCRQTGSAARKGRVGIWRHVVSGTSYIRVQVNRTKKKIVRLDTVSHFWAKSIFGKHRKRSLGVFFFFFHIGTVREKTSGAQRFKTQNKRFNRSVQLRDFHRSGCTSFDPVHTIY